MEEWVYFGSGFHIRHALIPGKKMLEMKVSCTEEEKEPATRTEGAENERLTTVLLRNSSIWDGVDSYV